MPSVLSANLPDARAFGARARVGLVESRNRSWPRFGALLGPRICWPSTCTGPERRWLRIRRCLGDKCLDASGRGRARPRRGGRAWRRTSFWCSWPGATRRRSRSCTGWCPGRCSDWCGAWCGTRRSRRRCLRRCCSNSGAPRRGSTPDGQRPVLDPHARAPPCRRPGAQRPRGRGARAARGPARPPAPPSTRSPRRSRPASNASGCAAAWTGSPPCNASRSPSPTTTATHTVKWPSGSRCRWARSRPVCATDYPAARMPGRCRMSVLGRLFRREDLALARRPLRPRRPGSATSGAASRGT